MKKILLIAALFVSTGIISSCTKENEVAPASLSKKVADEGDTDYTGIDPIGKLGTAPGGIDRPKGH
jgi:hypothetical protein